LDFVCTIIDYKPKTGLLQDAGFANQKIVPIFMVMRN